MKKALGLFFLLIILVPFHAFAQEAGLTVPNQFRATEILSKIPASDNFTFDFEGNYIFSEKVNNAYRIAKINPSGEETILLRTSEPIVGLSYYQGKVYVTFRGRISILDKGQIKDIISGIPASGDYGNSGIIFENGKLYFSVGTATNSGIVGPDNTWLNNQPSIHDLVCKTIQVNQTTIQSDNFLTKKKDDKASIGSFMPFNTPNFGGSVYGSSKCNGSIIRANPDGSTLEMYAWGFHNPKGISFDSKGILYTLDQAMENRGLRPVINGMDSVYQVSENTWYGWPDFESGKSIGQALIKNYPNNPPQPLVTFKPGHFSNFIFNQFSDDSAIAIEEANSISELSLTSNDLKSLFTSKDKILQMKFGPDKNLYVLIENGKTSSLYKIESLHAATVFGTTSNKSTALNWLVSVLVTLLGMAGAFYIYRTRQKTI